MLCLTLLRLSSRRHHVAWAKGHGTLVMEDTPLCFADSLALLFKIISLEFWWTYGLCPEGENVMDYIIVDYLCVYLHMFVPTVSMAAGGYVAL